MNVKFSDGTLIMQEPTGQDSLVYYVPGGDWAQALGIQILPLYEEHKYEEHKSTAVTIRFWKDDLARIEALDDSELKVIVGRLADGLSRQYSRWKNLNVEWPGWFLERLGEAALIQPFADSGWILSLEPPASFLWER